MEISERRLLNAKLILEKMCGGNKSKMARTIGKAPQLLNKWWSEDEAMKRNIGPSSARLIEEAFDLQRGWLDEAHDNASDLENDDQSKLELKARAGETYIIPLVGGALLDHRYKLTLVHSNKGKLMLLSTDKDAHAFQLVGHNPNPILDSNWGLIVEPNTPLAVNEYVLIRLNTGEILLRLIAFQENDTIIARHPITGEQTRLEASQINKAEYCYIGIPPSKIKLDTD